MPPDRQISRPGSAGAPSLLSEQSWLFPLLALVLLAIPVSTLWMIFRLYYDVPWGDQISLFLPNQLPSGLTLAKLFRFANEHQIVYTRLLIYFDYAFLHGSTVLPYAASIATFLGICLFYCWILQRFGNLTDRRQLLVACGLLVTLYFNGRMLLTITYSFLFVHPSTALAALISFFAFCRLLFALGPDETGSSRPRMFWLVFVLVGSYVIAATSSATGVLVGPAMLVVLGALLIFTRMFPARVAVRIGAVVTLATILVTGVYFAAYLHSTGGRMQPRVLHPLSDLRFLAEFVGAAFFRDSDWPVPHHSNPVLMYSVAALFWLGLVWIALQLYRRRRHLTTFEIFHTSVIVFVVLAGAVGGPFRADLGSLEAINKKYAPIALLAWISAASLLIYLRPKALFGLRPSSWTRPLLICSALVLLLTPGDLTEFHVWQQWIQQVHESAVAAASGVYSQVQLDRMFYDNAQAYQVAQSFIKGREFCYRRMPPPGYLLRDRFRVVNGHAERLAAAVSPLEQMPGKEGFTAAGSSASLASSAFPSLLVVDSDERVIGYGSVSSFTPGIVRLPKVREWFVAFRPRSASASGPVRVYQVDGATARLAGEISVPARPPSSIPPVASAALLPRVPDHMDYGLEVFNGVSTPLIKPPVRVPAAGDISLTGWAVDRDAGGAVAGLEVLIDGKPYPVHSGLARADVAAFFKQPGFVYSGFSFNLPAAGVGAGHHELRFRIYTNGGKSYLVTRVYPFFIQ